MVLHLYIIALVISGEADSFGCVQSLSLRGHLAVARLMTLKGRRWSRQIISHGMRVAQGYLRSLICHDHLFGLQFLLGVLRAEQDTSD